MNNKYEFTGEEEIFCGVTLKRIRAKNSFGSVTAGEIGGWIESEKNLSVSGNAWVSDDAQVYGNARVYGNAWVSGNAQVSGNAWVYGQKHFLCIGPIGSRFGFTTFFRTKSLEIFVSCGCFLGSLEDFLEQVSKTHGNNMYAKQYIAATEVAKACIDLTPEAEE